MAKTKEYFVFNLKTMRFHVISLNLKDSNMNFDNLHRIFSSSVVNKNTNILGGKSNVNAGYNLIISLKNF